MAKMSAKTVLFLISLSILQSATKDLLHGKSGRNSNKVLVKYEGTLEEVKAYGSGLGLKFKTAVFKDWYVFTIPQADSLGLTDVPDIHLDLMKEQQRDRKVKFIQQEKYVLRKTRSMVINDEKWSDQWHLQPTQTPNMNVYKAWEKGFTGAGVNVIFIDDGIDTEHPDLMQNYNPALSYDYIENTDDPSHKHPEEGHGSNSAGVAGASNDTNCVIGIANEISMGAVRLITDNYYTSSDEAMALTHKFEYVDIYSNSWGPNDDGKAMDSLHAVLQDAFELTIKEGRNGKGVIHTWASGNGGDYDNCNADLYSSSMYTIAIAAVDKSGSRTYFSEACTSILAATFSGNNITPNITTTGPNGTCVDDFSGTSAACPMATGIIALTLEANPDLTWRDVQHMVVEYSNMSALNVSSYGLGRYALYKNGAGKQVSIYAGFGLMDAKAMVDNAPTWSTVPPRVSCTSGDMHIDRTFHEETEFRYNFTDCYIQFLEHVEIAVMYNASYRGDVEFYLYSPMQTESILFSSRPDDSSTQVVVHQFVSVHNWGEDPHGEWILVMYSVYEGTEMHLFEWRISLFGTATDPLRGIPSAGTFGSPCNNTSSCASVVDGGCLKDTNRMCDNICIPCKNGYHLNGDYCEKDCPPLVSVTGSYIVLSNESGLTVARYYCYPEIGFISMTGNGTRTCGADGIWTGTEPTCNLIDCGPLRDPVNGNVSYFETTYDSIAVYECAEGFTVSEGDYERWCLINGEWDGTEPTCSPDCGPLEAPENGNVTFIDTFEGSEANYTCIEGYILAEGEAKRTCGKDGNWSSINPVCLIDCGPLQNPANGNVSYTETFEGSKAVYTCEDDYIISEGVPSRTCEEDGHWSSVQPVCSIDCGHPVGVVNGNVSFTETFEGADAVYMCNNGYTLTGGYRKRTCEGDGKWSFEVPKCLRDCGRLNSTDNGVLALTSTTEGSIALYVCKSGYGVSSGHVLRTCGSDGRWTGEAPVCDIDCGQLENPEHGIVTFTSSTKGSEAMYICINGYHISSGDSKRVCDATGNWNGMQPVCSFDESTETKEESTNVIAIVVGSVLGGILIIGIVAFALVLNYKRHTTKSGYVAN